MQRNDKLVENESSNYISGLPSLFINMAVPVSFFHRDKARVDLGGGADVRTVPLLPLVEDLAWGEGPVDEAKMRGFVLTDHLDFYFFFTQIYCPFSFLQYIIIIFSNRSRK